MPGKVTGLTINRVLWRRISWNRPWIFEALRGQAAADHLLQRGHATGSQYAAAMPSVPVKVELGGVTVFVMDLEKLEKF